MGCGSDPLHRRLCDMKQLAAALCQYSMAFFAVLTLNFLLIHLMPGDPLVHILGEEGYFFLSSRPPAYLDTIRRNIN